MWIKQKTTDILKKMISKKEKHITEKTGNSPTHIPASSEQPSNYTVDQKLLW
jgi:hypothetical protein